MAKYWFFLIAIVYWAIVMGIHALALTEELDGQTIRELYRSLNNPSQLKYWKTEGGDPCEELWMGVQCAESSIVHIELHKVKLSGTLSSQLSNLKNLKHLDLSSNHIEGSVPYALPPNLTYLNLAENKLHGSFPYSLESLKHLHHLNLSHNLLLGPIGDVFDGLESLREMDLSFNNFTGDLPPSFRNLTVLKGLFMQSNQFTGSVIFLANLTLTDLNIEDNNFSGVIPEKFQTIPNLRMWGNSFGREINYPPWRFPSETMPGEQNISSPPAANLSAFESLPSQQIRYHQNKKQPTAGITLAIGGVAVLVACVALGAVIYKKRTHGQTLSSEMSEESVKPLPIDTSQGRPSMTAQANTPTSSFSSSPMVTPSHLPPIRTKTVRMSGRKSYTKSRVSVGAKQYTVADLQEATNSFSNDNLIGEGSLGSVYKAEFPDGTILAVKNIKTVPLSIIEEQQFLDVIRSASRLRHPNIVTLLGYCMEHGQHLIMYEFIRKLSLEEALHSNTYKPLSWGLRLRIALGVARALNYLHTSCVPAMAHSNLKAANVMLDDELMARVSDCGLAILRSLTSNRVKLQASEMAIADSGYIAPDHTHPGSSNTKADVYAFGVLLLEILTGRKPVDNSRPKAEQSLVRWAATKLHDCASLRLMVDPSLKGTISSKSLSRYADIVSLCIQPEQEFRPSMAEIVESLMTVLQKPNAPTGTEGDPFEKSFRSSNSLFFCSPTLSYYSV